jgi:hypothetical protein
VTIASQHGAHTRHELVDGKWLDEDIIGAGIERVDAAIEIVLGGQDDGDRIDDAERTDDLARVVVVDIDDGDGRSENPQQGLQVTASLLGEHVEP